MVTTYIKLDRKIINWEWYQDVNTCRLFIHLLLMANHAQGRWQGQLINRGQLITGLEKLSKSTGLTVRQLRVSFDKLKLTGEIEVKTTNKNRIVTICKYDDYQSDKFYNDRQNDKQNVSQMANRWQTNDKPMTANNNEKNNKEEKEYNNKINAGGEISPPRTPEMVSGFNYLPDGRSYIEPTFFYKASDFNGLPDENIKSVIDFFDATKSIKVESERITTLWSVFKTQELTEQKPYRNKEDVYRHFLNWCKKQSFTKTKKTSTTKYQKEKTDVKITGIEFINNFSQCKMSDGSIQDLDINQQDLAKYNQINPKSISKN